MIRVGLVIELGPSATDLRFTRRAMPGVRPEVTIADLLLQVSRSIRGRSGFIGEQPGGRTSAGEHALAREFLEATCEFSATRSVSVAEVRLARGAWISGGRGVFSLGVLNSELRKRDCGQFRARQVRCWRGVCLRSASLPAIAPALGGLVG